MGEANETTMSNIGTVCFGCSEIEDHLRKMIYLNSVIKSWPEIKIILSPEREILQVGDKNWNVPMGQLIGPSGIKGKLKENLEILSQKRNALFHGSIIDMTQDIVKVYHKNENKYLKVSEISKNAFLILMELKEKHKVEYEMKKEDGTLIASLNSKDFTI